MYTIRNILLTALILTVIINPRLRAQGISGIAGEDKTTCRNPVTGLTDSVTIGISNVGSWCYTWSPASGIEDIHSGKTRAAPATTTTYTLKAVTEDFAKEIVDEVTVYVEDGVNSISATPKKCCYKAGESLDYSLFNITTDPPGMDEKVKVSPASVPVQSNYEYDTDITLTLENCEGGDSVSTTVTIHAVNEDFMSGFSIGFPIKYMEKLNEAMTTMNNLLELINEGIATKVSLCAADAPSWSIGYNYSTGLMCCPDKSPCVDSAYSVSLNVGISGGITCDFPFYGVPYIASLNVRVVAGAGATLTGTFKTICDGGEICLALGVSGTLGGGLSGTVLGKAALDASLILQGTLSAEPVKLCIYPAVTLSGSSQVCFQADLVGSITLISLINISGTWPVIAKSCVNLL
ncbi:MAG TPA: hypothetical protein P5531_02265 [Bacteroidales bacterium]|nr:hypothetical protein [Bacteroidales bacterium]HSA43117.1 hypothetical protein [Bacteroidales bacterium]